MFLNYVKLAIRRLLRNPFLTFINVIGLSLGFTTFYALWQFAISELKADQYHKDFERIVRVGVNYKWTDDGGETWGHILMASPLTPQFYKVQDDYPEVESSVSFLQQESFTEQTTGHGTQTLISVNDLKKHALVFNEQRIVYADSNLFSFFSIPLVYGKAEDVLSEAGFVVLSQSTALKYFGKRDPIGEILELNDSLALKVTGIFEDLPHYTHLNFDVVISNKNLHNRWKNLFENWAHSYLKLTEQSNVNSFESKLNTQASKYFADHMRTFPQTKLDFFVQPLKDVSFSQSLAGDNFYPKSRSFLLTLAFIAISVLFMAQANYINLTLTRTMGRLKKVATRKVTGATMLDMAKQFVTEAFVVTVVALTVSFALIQLIRTPVALLFNIPIVKPSTLDPSTQFVFLLMISTGVLLSGLYPALVSSAYHPKVLFQLSKIPSRKRIIPSLLTISQFSAALVFILFGFVLAHQLDYILNKAIGIKRDEIVIVEAPVIKPPDFDQNFSSFKKQLARYPDVQAVTESSSIVGDNFHGNGHIKRVGSDLFYGINNFGIDENFIPFYSVKMLAGRNFVIDDRADVTMLSRVAARRLGFESPVDAIGATIQVAHGYGLEWVWKNLEVIGVFEDFRMSVF